MRENRMHGSRWRRQETRPVGPARAAQPRRLSPTLLTGLVATRAPRCAAADVGQTRPVYTPRKGVLRFRRGRFDDRAAARDRRRRAAARRSEVGVPGRSVRPRSPPLPCSADPANAAREVVAGLRLDAVLPALRHPLGRLSVPAGAGDRGGIRLRRRVDSSRGPLGVARVLLGLLIMAAAPFHLRGRARV